MLKFLKGHLRVIVVAVSVILIANSCTSIGSTQKTYTLQYKVFTTVTGVQPSFSVSYKNKEQAEELFGPITSTFWLSELVEEIPDGFVAQLKVSRNLNNEIPLTLEILRDGAVHASITLKSFEQEIELEKEL